MPKPQLLLHSDLTCGRRHTGPEQLRHNISLRQNGGDQLSFTPLLAEVTYQLPWISVAAGPSDLAQASSALTEQDAGSLHLTQSDQICSDRVRNRLPASGSVTADEA